MTATLTLKHQHYQSIRDIQFAKRDKSISIGTSKLSRKKDQKRKQINVKL